MFCALKSHLVGEPDKYDDGPSLQQNHSWVADGLVAYHGWLDDIITALVKATVVVLPSYREGTPRSLLEAMAIGRPIITKDAPGCGESVFEFNRL